MSAAAPDDFLAYWAEEGARYARHGDYRWMAHWVPGARVLEIGCGLGFSTQALIERGLSVLTIDTLSACLAATAERAAAATRLKAEVKHLSDEQYAQIAAFSPESIVCWLMGAPAEVTGAQAGDRGQAVIAYREKTHRAVAELAARLSSVQAVHFVDRTAIAWQAKDIGRDTLLAYHHCKTLLDLPFIAARSHVSYRKITDPYFNSGKLSGAMRGAVPTLASLLAERKK